jgi:hypothetical protein
MVAEIVSRVMDRHSAQIEALAYGDTTAQIPEETDSSSK